MQIKKLNSSVYAVRLEKGEEVIQSLGKIAKDHQIGFGTIEAIGALKEVELGFFYTDKKEFLRRKFKDDYELLGANGNISWLTNGEPAVHIHASLGGEDFQVIGGHLFSGLVAVTFECFIHTFPVKTHKIPNKDLGINTWDFKNCRYI